MCMKLTLRTDLVMRREYHSDRAKSRDVWMSVASWGRAPRSGAFVLLKRTPRISRSSPSRAPARPASGDRTARGSRARRRLDSLLEATMPLSGCLASLNVLPLRAWLHLRFCAPKCGRRSSSRAAILFSGETSTFQRSSSNNSPY